jgi:hypothetical protein
MAGGTSGHSQSMISETGFKPSYNFPYVVCSTIDSNICMSFLCDYRKALFLREERADDIPKLIEFFRTCKWANEYFYWNAQTDIKTGELKNIF